MTTMMKEKLNLSLGSEVVRDIVLKAGRVENQTREVPDEATKPRTLSSRQLAQIEGQAASIPDPETRQAFIELMKASMEHSR